MDPARSSCSRWARPASCSRCGATASSRTSTPPRPTNGSCNGSRVMAERVGLDPERRRQLEEERDFLMQSLDDLELEHESGGIDDESYAELHDDYTARAAAVIRTLRDGVDVTPPTAAAVDRQRTRRRVVLVSARARVRDRRGNVARVRARRAPPGADVVGQLGGRAVDDERRAGRAARRRSTTCRRRSTPVPTTTTCGSSSRARTRRTATSRTRSSSRTPRSRIDTNRPEGNANSARLLYLASEVAPAQNGEEHADRAGVGRVQQGHHRRTRLSPTATTSAPCCTRSRLARLRRARRPICRTTW